MKALHWLLVASLLGNVVLVGLNARKPSHAAGVPPASNERTGPDSAPGGIAAAPATVHAHGRKPAIAGNTWSDLASDDFHVLRDRLRAAGFPEHIVQRLIVALINDRFATLERDLYYKPNPTFWQDASLPTNPELDAARNRNGRERKALLRDLLGTAHLAYDDFHGAYLRQSFAPLAPEKLGALRAMHEDYWDRRSEIQSGGLPSADLQEKVYALGRELREKLARQFTPAEIETYEMRNGNAAGNARRNLETFRATEAEYRLIYQAHRAWIEPVPTQVQTDGRAEMSRQLELGLGPERYADYQQANDTQHRTLNQIVTRFDLPLSAARATVAVQQDISRRADAVRAQPDLSAPERAAQFATLAQEARTKISAVLGPRALAAYQQTSGQWLASLARPPTP